LIPTTRKEAQMTEPKIKRKSRTFSLALTTTTTTAVPIRFDDVAGGAIVIGTAASSFASISVWAADSATSTYGRVYKVDGSVSNITLASSTSEPRVYPLPDECYCAGAVKLVADQAAGTAASCVVMLKG
jgi:hypothetical protein